MLAGTISAVTCSTSPELNNKACELNTKKRENHMVLARGRFSYVCRLFGVVDQADHLTPATAKAGRLVAEDQVDLYAIFDHIAVTCQREFVGNTHFGVRRRLVLHANILR